MKWKYWFYAYVAGTFWFFGVELLRTLLAATNKDYSFTVYYASLGIGEWIGDIISFSLVFIMGLFLSILAFRDWRRGLKCEN